MPRVSKKTTTEPAVAEVPVEPVVTVINTDDPTAASPVELQFAPLPEKPPSPHAPRRAELTRKVDALLERYVQHRYAPPDSRHAALEALFLKYCRSGKLDEDEAIADALEIQYQILNTEYQDLATKRAAQPATRSYGSARQASVPLRARPSAIAARNRTERRRAARSAR